MSADLAFDAVIKAMTVRAQSQGPRPLELVQPGAGVGFGSALISSWASVLDILGFYEARLRDESFLSTALEAWSIQQHARLLGYEPAPGLSATAYLAFTLSSSPALAMPIIVPASTSVRSAPLGTGAPQVFETTNALHAHTAFNAMPAVLESTEHRPTIHPTTTVVHVKGAPAIRPGDAISVDSTNATPSDPLDLRIVHAVTRRPGASTTTLALAPSATATAPAAVSQLTIYKALGGLFGHDAPQWADATPAAQHAHGISRAGAYTLTSTDAPDWIRSSDGLTATPTCGVRTLDGWLVGTESGGVVARSGDEPDGSWEPSNRGLTSKAIYALATGPDDATLILAGGANGAVFSSVDGGRQWDRIGGRRTTTITQGATAPTPAPTPAAKASKKPAKKSSKKPAQSSSTASTVISTVRNALPPAAVRSLLAVNPADKTQALLIYAGTDQGLFQASGFASGWSAVDLGPGAPSDSVAWALHADDHGNIFAGTETTILQVGEGVALDSEATTGQPSAPKTPETGRVYAFASTGTSVFAATDNGIFYQGANEWVADNSWVGGKATAIAATPSGLIAWSSATGAASHDGSGWRTLTAADHILWPEHTGSGPLTSVAALITSGSTTLALSNADGFANTQWPHFTVGAGTPPSGIGDTSRSLDLSTSAGISIGDTIALHQGPETADQQPANLTTPPARTWKVDVVSKAQRSDFGLSASVQRATVNVASDDTLGSFDLRTVRAFKATSANAEPVDQPGTPTKRQVSTSAGGSHAEAATPVYGHAASHVRTTSPKAAAPVGAQEHDALGAQIVQGGIVEVHSSELPEPGRLVSVAGQPCRGRLATPGGVDIIGLSDAASLRGWSIAALATHQGLLFASTQEGPVFTMDVTVRDDVEAPDGRIGDTHFPGRGPVTTMANVQGTVWAGTQGGEIYSWSEEGGWHRRHDLAHPAGSNVAIRALLQPSNRRPDVFVGTDSGVWRVTSDRVQRDRLAGHIHTFLSADDRVLAGTSDGVWERIGSSWERCGQEPMRAEIISLAHWRNRIHAISATGALWRLDSTDEWTPVALPWGCQDTTAALVMSTGDLVLAGCGTVHRVDRNDQARRINMGSSNAITALVEFSEGSTPSLVAGSERTTYGFDKYGQRAPLSPPSIGRLDSPGGGASRDDATNAGTTEVVDVGATEPSPADRLQQIAHALDRGTIPPALPAACAPHRFPQHGNVRTVIRHRQWKISHGTTELDVTRGASSVRISGPMPLLPIVSLQPQGPPTASERLDLVEFDHPAAGQLHLTLFSDELSVHAPAKTATVTAEIRSVLSATLTRSGVVRLELDRPLDGVYDATSTTVNANVVAATQGRTVRTQVLGSGDATKTLQTFRLQPGDLSQVLDATGTPEPSITVRIGDHSPVLSPTGPQAQLNTTDVAARWTRVDSLLDARAGQHAFMLRHGRAVDGAPITEVAFGDGANGARLPTGSGNVAATFRVGVGGPSLATGAVHVVGDLPAGVRSVANPTPTQAGIKPQTGVDLRNAVPAWTRYTPRVVTLADYRAFALHHPGIGKVAVAELFNGRRRAIHLSVADDNGTAPSSSTLAALRDSLSANRLGTFPLVVEACEIDWFQLRIELALSAHDVPAEVRSMVVDGLLARFGPAQAEIGAPMQEAAVQLELKELGVLTRSTIVGFAPVGCPAPAERVLTARTAEFVASLDAVRPASLLALAAATLEVDVRVAP